MFAAQALSRLLCTEACIWQKVGMVGSPCENNPLLMGLYFDFNNIFQVLANTIFRKTIIYLVVKNDLPAPFQFPGEA